MKTKLLLLLLLANFSIYAQNTAIPDINFENKLIALGYDTAPADGQVPTANISGVTSLDLSNNSITDLTGIEDFTALQNFRCSFNDVTTVDLSKNLALYDLRFDGLQKSTLDLSKNVNLEILSFVRTPLTSIDVSANLKLRSLTISGGGMAGGGLITSIDLSQNQNLRTLELNDQKITNPDFSTNPLLEKISFQSSNLPNLDFSQNIALKDLNLNYCSQIQSIDLSNNINLSVLSISQTKISNLDLSKNAALKMLICENAEYLETLNLKNGTNTSINPANLYLKKTPGLYCILVDDPQFSEANWSVSKEDWKHFSAVCETPKYTLIPDPAFEGYLAIKGAGSVIDGKVLTAAVATTIKELDLNYTNYVDIKDLTGIEDFAALEVLITPPSKMQKLNVTKNTALKTLKCNNLEANTLDVSNNINLTVLECSSKNLTSLDVSNNKLLNELSATSSGLTTIDVSNNTELKKLVLYNNKLTSLDLSKNNKLTEVNTYLNSTLKCVQVADVDFALANWKIQKDNTTSYNLDCNVYTLIPDAKFEDKLIALSIDTDGKNGKVITTSIASVKALNVSGSGITDLTGIEDFVSLEAVDFSNNALTSVNLSNNVKLTSFHAEKNQLTDLNIENLVNLKRLYFGNNKLTSLNTSKNTLLEYFNGNNNLLTSLDFSANTALTNIYCTDNALTSLNFSNNSTLVTLWCQRNKLPVLDVSANLALSEFTCGRNQLEVLDVSKNTALKTFSCEENKIKTLDVSKNPLLTIFRCNINSLESLNLQNGNNTLLDKANLTFTSNLKLTCIQVDDVTYSDANWTTLKDVSASYNLDCSTYTLIPDPNFEDKLIALDIDKDGKNGKVLTSNIASLTSLNVSKSSISDLTGIQDFKALTDLYVSQNLLTNLDLSSNTKLENLQAQKNQLVTLNVSKNTALTTLGCSANKLTTLDISTLTALKDLSCSINKLTDLNVENNLALTDLNCGYNQITGINVSKNTALVNFYAYTNQITSLDVSNNILLQNFMCNDNKLTEINVSKNTELVLFDCLDNQLTSLDISKNPKITELACENNKLTSLNLKNGGNTNLDLTFSNFSNNPDLKCIQVDDVAYSVATWSAIKDATAEFNTDCRPFTLIPDPNFEDKLILLNIDKDGKNGKVVTEDIASITTLDISNSSIADLTGIQDFAALTTLNCSTNSLTALDISANKKLSVLNSSTNQITALSLDNNIALTDVNVAYNLITSLSIVKNPALIKIDFSNNALNTLNLKNGFNTNLDWFSVNFTKNPALSCIQVDNAIYSNDNWNGKLDKTSYFTEDCNAFTLIPDSNFEQKLIDLKIDIDGKNGKVLTASISKVTDLNVQLSEINDLTGIEDFTALEYLNCQFNNLSSLNVSKNSKLIELYTHGNNLTALNLTANTELTTLQANKNQITTLDISKNTKLVYINVSENKLRTLNLKNGNNNNFQGALLVKNPTLSCISVDNPSFANASTSIFFKDETASFNTECILYTLIPDVNFENKLIALGIDSGTPNGKIETSKISSITELDLYGSFITDLTGIQDFASLTSLSVMSNKLTSVDVSQNLALTYLNVSWNTLTTLDVSKNIALENLSINNNNFTSIDVSHNNNLQYFTCLSNQLTDIDVTKNQKLRSLWCSSNQITTLDLSKNTSLTAIICTDSKLSSINLKNGNNQSITNTSINLKNNPFLKCILVDNALYSNTYWTSFKDASAGFSTVDCSSVTVIPDLAFEAKLIDLGIDTDGTNGTVLNSSISSLLTLNVSNSSIKDLTGIEGFTNLKNLDCSGNLISNLNLSQNKLLATLDCNNNKLLSLNLKNGDKTNFSSGSNFSNNADLTCIQVEDADYATTTWTSIKDATASYNVDCNAYTSIPDPNFEDKLIALDIDKDGKNGKVLSASIKKVTYLDLSNSNISDATGIEDFTSLTYLDLSLNNLSTINVSQNTLLLKLDLNYNKITNLDLSTNKELFNLSFAGNQISTIDLSQNKKLHYLSADYNSLSVLDLTANNELEIISCGSNNLTTLDTSNHANLITLLCELNKISALNLSNNLKLDILQCYSNNLTSLDLSHNTELTRLNAASNNITSLDLSQNKKLVLVYLVLNPLTTLNVQNGNNENFIVPPVTGKKMVDPMNYTSFLQIKTLSCIQVDNVEFSNSKWSGIKETSATYSTTCKNLGIEDSVFEKVVMFPNPTKGEVTISNVTLEKATVYNTLGQLVRSFTLDSANTSNTIDLSGLPRGVYYVYLINQDAASAKKVIVE
ncbi:T9SS type A sorting domain-containing protein [uncultured Flavobacterium sp.]|uniref:T9SS type A sorting domain-containing protein n=1 Tax=uncultured Flavobacterium sp. TaxID=165435 RepID=UPI0030816F0E